MQKKEYSIEVEGKTITAEFNDLVARANGSVIMRSGNTAVLVTAVMGGEKEIPYFPLSVEYEERFYAAGAILGSRFQRREGRPSDEAVLSARVIDRTIRPLFDHSLRREIQVVATVLSIDKEDPDVLGVIGASLALAVSDIPWGGPVSAVRIGKDNQGTLATNPDYEHREDSTLDLLVCGKDGNVNMIEVGAHEMPEEELAKALEEAVVVNNKIEAWQKEIIAEIGKEKKENKKREVAAVLKELFSKEVEPKMDEYVFQENDAYGLKDIWMSIVAEHAPDESKQDAGDYFEEQIDHFVHIQAIEHGRRQDGRAMDEIRPLFAQAGGISEIIHGTGIFYRGETHVLSALTLGGPSDAQLVDTIEAQESSKRYMHHYNFPPFSVGETGRVGGFNRRMIGHGALAEKALIPVLPAKEVFPYTIRIVSETMTSNGSSSMASVCGSTLALMDAGVPIVRPVAGIAMGMMSDASGAYKILTDIQGPEDHFGDMDFKVAGTTEGVTAVQMDVKVSGVPVPVLVEGLIQAKKARLEILAVLKSAIAEPRTETPARAPKIITMTIPVEQIGLVIGPGGKMINGIKDDTGVDDITIEDDGTIYMSGKNGTAEAAHARIQAITKVFAPGERAEGEVTRVLDFGAFVRISPTTEGLVHISELAPFRVARVADVVSVGETVPVIIKEIDEKGRYNLSLKDADADFATRKGVTPSQEDHDGGTNKQQHERSGRGRGPRI